MYIPKKAVASPMNIADGEYTAEIARIRMTKDNESVMFICKLTTPGFEDMEVAGFARANWNKPTGRTTANLYAWVKNLGGNLVDDHEDEFDIETLKGAKCRVIVQSYVRKSDGAPAIKVGNILPLNKRPIPNPMPAQTGLHVGGASQQAAQAPAQQAQMASPAATPAAAPAATATPTPTVGSESTDNLW